MRNPNRIQEFMKVLQGIWDKQPDTRFNQLVHNLQCEYSILKGGYKETVYEKEEIPNQNITAYRSKEVVDLFSVEDDDFLAFLKTKL